MYQRIISLILYTIFACFILIGQAETSTFDIYVNNQASSSSENGSKDYPYKSIKNGLLAVRNAFLSKSYEVNILIAPSSQNYKLLGNYEFNMEQQEQDFILQLSPWIENYSCVLASNCSQVPTLDFSESKIDAENITLKISNMNLLPSNGFSKMKKCSLIFENLTTFETQTRRSVFIHSTIAKTLSIVNMSMNFEKTNPFVHFSFTGNPHNDFILIKNITLNTSQEEDEKGITALRPLFSLTEDKSYGAVKVSCKIQQIQIKSLRKKFALAPFLTTNKLKKITIEDISFDNQTFSLSPWFSWVLIEDAENLNINNMSFTGNNIEKVTSNPLIKLKSNSLTSLINFFFSNNNINKTEENTFNFISASKMSRLNIIKHSILNNIINGDAEIIKVLDQQSETRSFSSVIQNVTLQNNTNVLSTNHFSFVSLEYTGTSGIEMQDINYSMNTLSGRIFLLQPSLAIKYFNLGSIQFPSKLIASDINIQDNNAIDTNFIYLVPLIDSYETINCNSPLDAFKIEISNLKVINNTFKKGLNINWFNQVGLFQVQSTGISITDSNISNNTFEYYDFAVIDQRASSMSFVSSEFVNNKLYFSNFLHTNYETVDGICEASFNKIDDASTLIYRQNSVIDSTFDSLLLNSSSLHILNNPYFFVKGNIYRNIRLIDSNFISTVLSLPRWQNFNSKLKKHSLLEGNTVGSFSQLKEAYSEALKEATLENIGNSYYYRMTENNFTNIISTSSKIISVTGFNLKEDFLSFTSNNFTNIICDRSPINPIILIKKASNVIIRNNSFENFKGRGVVFSLSQNQVTPLLKLESNYIKELYIVAFLMYEGDSLGKVDIYKNILANSKIILTGISLSTKYAILEWIFDQNHFYDLNFEVDPSVKQSDKYGLISISVDNMYSTSSLSITNSIIEDINISFTGQGNLNPELHLVSIESLQPVGFSNVTFRSSNFFVEGNLISLKKLMLVTIEDCNFSKLKLRSQTGLINLFSTRISVFNSKFNDIYNYKDQGVFFISPNQAKYTFVMDNCSFEKIETMQNAILSVIPPFNIELSHDDTPELNNDSYSIRLNWANIEIKEIDNLAYLSLFDGNCEKCNIQNVSVHRKSHVNSSAPSFRMIRTGGNLAIQNISIPPNRLAMSPFIEIQNSIIEFSLGDVLYKGNNNPLYLARIDSGTLIIKNSIFEDIDNNEISIINAFVEDDQLQLFKKVYKPIIFLDNTTFRRIRSNLISEIDQEGILQTLIQFEVNPNKVTFPVASIVFSAIPTSVFFFDCLFEDITNMPAFLLVQTDNFPCDRKRTNPMRFINTIFRRLKFPLGSAISLLPNCYNPSISIQGSQFENNKALLGGALAIFNGEVRIINSIFKENQADLLGAAFYAGTSVINKYFEENVKFINNTGPGYSEVVSEVSNLVISFDSDSVNTINTFSSLDTRNQLSMKNVSCAEFQQGYLNLDFVDIRNKPTQDFSTTRQITFALFSPSNPTKYDNTFAASGICDLNSCKVFLKGVTLPGRANEEMSLKLQYTSDRMNQTYMINITMRSCLPGEYNNSLSCEACMPSTFSVSPDRPCTQCPINANCPKQNKICPNSGYWNANQNSSLILPCLNDEEKRCERKPGECRTCQKGYEGPLCSACDFKDGYVESGYFKCKKCEEANKELMIVLIGGFVVLLFQAFAIYLLYSVNKKTENNDTESTEMARIERSFYVKSLISYLQLMSILSLTDSQIFNNFGLASRVGSLSSLIVYGTQCAMKALHISPDNFLYYQTYLSVAAPWIQFGLISFIISIVGLINRNIQVKKILTVAGLYFIISSQPGLVTNLTLFVSCKTLDGAHYFITSHPNWSCRDPTYIKSINYIVIPNLLFWVLIIPIALFAIIFKNKSNLKSEKFKGYLGVLTLDLKENRYYWGIIQMVQKLILSLLVYGLEIQLEVQIFSFMLLMWIYQSSVRFFRPYSIKLYNTLEVALSNLVIFNIITAKYLLCNRYGNLVREISLVVCIVINAIFLLFVIFKILALTIYKKVRVEEERFLESTQSLLSKNRKTSEDSKELN